MSAVFFRSAAEFRRWLKGNRARVRELWLGFYKKDSGKRGITYRQALDEALCFGWIDGVRKRFDEVSYVIRFSPRQPGSVWSEVNVRRVGELEKLGRVAPAGLKLFQERDRAKAKRNSFERRIQRLGDPYEKRLRANRKVWKFFRAQPPWFQRTISRWVRRAMREETRHRRLATLIQAAEKGRRPAAFILRPGKPGKAARR